MTARAGAQASAADRATTALFTLTAFTGAALLFVVQPLVARLLLPSYGGSATLWSTASLFFQMVLLGAYLWAHWSARRFGHRWQPRLQLVLLLVPVLVLPVALPSGSAPGADHEPTLWLLRTLVLMVGLPFAVVACTGPVIQRWYSWVGHRGEDPYFLFAASNLGSFVGLLAYPFLIEPQLSLATQRLAWSVGFGVYAALMVACALLTVRGPDGETPVPAAHTPRPTGRTILTWGLLAFVPSSLMLGVTAHLSTDVSPIPLLWVVPLAVYLATFVVAFARTSRRPPVWAALLAAVLGLVALVLSGETTRLGPVAAVNIALVAVAGYAAHGRLAAGRPPADHLTLFYLVVASGGAAGGLLNGLLAPLLLDSVLEYPVLLACLPLLLLGTARPDSRPSRRALPGVATALLLAFALWTTQIQVAGSIEQTRSFSGASRVEAHDGRHVLVHGNTVHGMQYRDEERRSLATTYYGGNGSCADVFDVLRGRLDEVGIVGLGSGTMATHGRAGERFTFVEIDPDIVATAQDPALFTYLADSAAETRVVVGDGRAEMAAQEPGTFDLLVLDAFSSDSIPVHLLTREAMREYAEAMATGGVLLVHISNRYFDLEPVLAAAAEDLGWAGVVGTSHGSAEGATSSTWVALTADPEPTRQLLSTPFWRPLRPDPQVRWTDDYSSVLAVLD